MTPPGTIRPYQPRDRAALYDICLRTGLNGADATGLYPDPELLGSVFAVPYAELEPELTFVIDNGQRAVGYILGTADTATYIRRYQKEWLPTLTDRFPEPHGEPTTPDERIRSFLHHPERILHPELADYPAHLHIDLLPSHQGGGFGRALINRFLGTLRERGIPGVHLAMGRANHNADAFYRRLGFHELSIPAWPDILYFTQKTND
ncbi:MAG TPA: GNAT family N-acetyltransferase [Pseudonocardiaceae bacterium]|jgi:GNAT superfamily N-acetyltransferase|nr:GNAT family N-acetyltransferase [Pseudonocardiaceae bacterium]